jgi:hypothetical protein
MNLRSTSRKIKPYAALLACCLAVFSVAATTRSSPFNEEEKPAKKEKAKTKTTFSSLNNPSVKIYPDAIRREMHVVAKENDGKEIDFFVFDLQGTLLYNYRMKSKDHNKISGLKRGTYVYRVFCGDDETATGRFEIR